MTTTRRQLVAERCHDVGRVVEDVRSRELEDDESAPLKGVPAPRVLLALAIGDVPEPAGDLDHDTEFRVLEINAHDARLHLGPMHDLTPRPG